MGTVAISNLPVGSAFRMPWREEGKDIGEVYDLSIGSAGVRIPEQDDDEWKWKTTRWALGTQVEPVPREVLNLQQIGRTERNKSSADSPVETVWQICTEMKGRLRDEIVAACVARGINKNTAKTQYYAWRKAQ